MEGILPTVTRWLAALAMALLLLSSPGAYAKWVDAGPIWNNFDAQQKCPSVCGGAEKWDGNWKTTQPGTMSVCSCKHHAGGGGGGNTGGPGASCSAPATNACPGCSISCPAGQAAHCEGGQDTSGGGTMCWTQPSCKCQ
jgi:hypothetical protein